MSDNVTNADRGTAAPAHPSHPDSAPKWAASVNDAVIPMPSRQVLVAVIRHQASVQADHELFRDHNTENDPLLPENCIIDLALGNVFYSAPACSRVAGIPCSAPAKLAFIMNDTCELVLRKDQTGQSLRELFCLPAEDEILRDLESPSDTVISDSDPVNFAEGCVFRSRHCQPHLQITVNKLHFTEKNGVKPDMTGREIASLVELQTDQTRVQRITASGPVDIRLNEHVRVANGDEFKVIRNNVNAGFQPDRVEHELTLLRERGARVTFIDSPVPAVIYHDVPVRPGLPVVDTDILVKVPSGYPGGIIDNAFLPEGSPLLTCSVGAVQQIEAIGDRRWQQKSIHPYTGNGFPWDKNRHGFHTYYNELVSWLHAGS